MSKCIFVGLALLVRPSDFCFVTFNLLKMHVSVSQLHVVHICFLGIFHKKSNNPCRHSFDSNISLFKDICFKDCQTKCGLLECFVYRMLTHIATSPNDNFIIAEISLIVDTILLTKFFV